MKIGIYYHFKEKPWGGANQFLKALKNQFLAEEVFVSDYRKADSIIFNGYQELKGLVYCFFRYPKKKIVFRLGPIMSLYRNGIKWKIVDMLVIMCANNFADVVIFQSKWSMRESIKRGFNKKNNVAVILNAVDGGLFFKKRDNEKREKIELIYTSWSANQKKGFRYLKYLDEHLDTVKYNATFIGNSPFVFKNIKILEPMSSKDLADKLRSSDIFVSPTKDDACSNALLEAISCGLPAVALDSGGNGELVGKGGLLFSNETEMLRAIDEVSQNIEGFSSQIVAPTIEGVAKEYLEIIRASIK